MMNRVFLLSPLLMFIFIFTFCSQKEDASVLEESNVPDTTTIASPAPIIIVIEKDLLYNEYTLADEYPYKDTIRSFQWDKIRDLLYLLDSVQLQQNNWAILQNYKNMNGVAPLVKEFKRNVYKRVADIHGVERFQSVPLFHPADTVTGERYGRDGSPVRYLGEEGGLARVSFLSSDEEWLVPQKYVKGIGDTITFNHAVFVDRHNQNIATLEKVGSKWLVRSMNPITTGLHRPPYAQETPLGIFLIQEKKQKMIYHKDGTTETGGFAPWASRFTNGAYLHGVPVNVPRTTPIEYSASLGTTPRSHMCVRNATSHAKFIYEWAPAEKTVVFVLE